MSRKLGNIIGAIGAVIGATAIGAALSNKKEQERVERGGQATAKNRHNEQDAPYQSISGLAYQDGLQTDERWQKKATPKVSQIEHLQSEKLSSSQTRECAFCGATIDISAKFCPFCGKADIRKKRFCVKCGAELGVDSRFCLQCGEKV